VFDRTGCPGVAYIWT